MEAVVPLAEATSTLAGPLLPGGVVQVAVIELVTLNTVQGAPPILMLVAPVRLEPMIVMSVPPAGSPVSGDTAVTVGGGCT